MSTPRPTVVYGPAYLDRVVRVDRPLIDPEVGGVVDRSAAGRWAGPETPGTITVVGLPTGAIAIAVPPDWPGRSGRLEVDGGGFDGTPRRVVGLDWRDDLGGMGAGFARAFGGTLVRVAADRDDPIDARVAGLLRDAGIATVATHVPGRSGEWTLLVSGGSTGDKLPIGFRDPGPVPPPTAIGPVDLLVAASMTNARAADALALPGARVRMFAPAIRNATDLSPRVSDFARHVDILCCNRAEWEAIDDREEVAWRVSILAITDGPRGASIRSTTPTGEPGRLDIPAFPRSRPIRDTNRAGEAFASTLVATLLDAGWSPGVTDESLLRSAATRASAAAAIVLDRVDFGFPTAAEIDRAVAAGVA